LVKKTFITDAFKTGMQGKGTGSSRTKKKEKAEQTRILLDLKREV